jgi:hypothetical protein
MQPAFHLSLSVSDLERTRAFYCERLGATPGRQTPAWIDLWLFGTQLTAYLRPKAVVPSPFREAQHFGATLAWADWLARRDALSAAGLAFAAEPLVDDARGVAKLMLADPDGYLVELKAYRDPAVLGRPAG